MCSCMCCVARFAVGLLFWFVCVHGVAAEDGAAPVVQGLTGRVNNVRVTVEGARTIVPLSAAGPRRDIYLQRMAAWAMNYLIRTPNKDLDYEPVFQCHPLRCPPVPQAR